MSVSTSMGVEQQAVNTIRTLAMDAVQAANSGHPGTPMALAPVAYVLWNRILRYDPANPAWPDRDRFVLSCGHASMLLYAVLHLAGVRDVDAAGKVLDAPAVPLDDIRRFRQLHSRCAGHPEYGEAPGIETTTGPLGQGLGNSVGMAIASRWLAARYNRPDAELFSYNVYALCSDGDLMEGVGAEAASLAGHLKLSNLCWIYDDNKITIEGHTDLAFSENVPLRFKGLGWNVVQVDDANDLAALEKAFKKFLRAKTGPTLIVVRSTIGYGSPNKANSHKAHGEPLGADEIRLTKEAYGWPADEQFLVPDEVLADFAAGIGKRGKKLFGRWRRALRSLEKHHPELAAEYQTLRAGRLPEGWDRDLPVFPADPKGMASRASSGKVLNAVARHIPWLVGGSADLAPSTNTLLTYEPVGDFSAANPAGRNFHWGIREHGMAAALNGMALCGLRPYGATFFVFTDYMRPAMRLAAIMKQPVLYVLTHDSIGVGEDGPTHQPVEHLAALRAIPGMVTLRPGDANEVAEAYRAALSLQDRPVALVLTRQNLPTLDRERYAAASGVARGGYVLAGGDAAPQVILIGTGSELSVAVEAYERLTSEGIAARVVSLPSWELFEAQPAEYREAVLPREVTARVAVEAGSPLGWERYVGTRGRFVGMRSFGASAPGATLFKHFGITPERVAAEAKELLAGP